MASTKTWLLSNSRTTYGNHQFRLLCKLSRLLKDRLADGDESSAFWITSGTCTPGARERPRPENMRMVSIPERRCACGSGGLGVVGLDGMGVTERDTTPFSLASLPFLDAPSFQDIAMQSIISKDQIIGWGRGCTLWIECVCCVAVTGVVH